MILKTKFQILSTNGSFTPIATLDEFPKDDYFLSLPAGEYKVKKVYVVEADPAPAEEAKSEAAAPAPTPAPKPTPAPEPDKAAKVEEKPAEAPKGESVDPMSTAETPILGRRKKS